MELGIKNFQYTMKTVKTDAVARAILSAMVMLSVLIFFKKMSSRKELFVSYFDENTTMGFHFVKGTPLLPITYWTIS